MSSSIESLVSIMRVWIVAENMTLDLHFHKVQLKVVHGMDGDQSVYFSKCFLILARMTLNAY